jgi:hypothetical protein
VGLKVILIGLRHRLPVKAFPKRNILQFR